MAIVSHVAAELPPYEQQYDAVPLDIRRLSELALTQVTQYPAPRKEPLSYPGVRPEHGFSTFGEHVLPLTAYDTEDGVGFAVATPEGVFSADDFLREQGAVPMSERVPVVGFGSNASPGQLVAKFDKSGDAKMGTMSNDADRSIFPTAFGTIRDVGVGYAAKLGIHGYFFGHLVEAPDAVTQVAVNFLAADQLARLRKTEGAYELCEYGEVQLDGTQRSLPAYVFLGRNKFVTDKAGRPVLMKEVTENAGHDAALSQTELQQFIADRFGKEIGDAFENVPIYIKSARDLGLLMSYRTNFITRFDTEKTKYAYNPAEGAKGEPLLSERIAELLTAEGMVSGETLLDSVPADKRNLTPKTLRELYTETI